MNLLTAMDSLLQHFYDSLSPPVGTDDTISGQGFYESVIVPAVQSPPFRRRLLHEPRAVFAERGIRLPEGVEVRFVENTEEIIHIVIPPYVGE